MSFLEMSQDELERAGAAWTAREIAQQPDMWLAAEGLMASGATRAFLGPLVSDPKLRIVFTGAGTSAFIGECLAPALTRRLGMRVHAIPTTDVVAAPDSWIHPDGPLLLVSFARSGNSPESVAALALTERAVAGCHHLVITCNKEGELYRQATTLPRSHAVLLPDETNDRGFAMTSSFSSMLLGGALAFDLLGPNGVRGLARSTGAVLKAFSALASITDAGYRRVVYLGSKEFKGLAREAAMKLLELTDGRVVATADTPLGFRHGPKSIIDDKTLVIVFASSDPYTRQYDLDLVAELRRDGVAARVLSLSAAHSDGASIAGAFRSDDDMLIADGAGASDLDLCFPYVVFAQSLALQQSLALKLRPDSPNARGTVNRVVQGVSLYRWEPRA